MRRTMDAQDQWGAKGGCNHGWPTLTHAWKGKGTSDPPPYGLSQSWLAMQMPMPPLVPSLVQDLSRHPTMPPAPLAPGHLPGSGKGSKGNAAPAWSVQWPGAGTHMAAPAEGDTTTMAAIGRGGKGWALDTASGSPISTITCRYGTKCRGEGCWFQHPEGVDLGAKGRGRGNSGRDGNPESKSRSRKRHGGRRRSDDASASRGCPRGARDRTRQRGDSRRDGKGSPERERRRRSPPAQGGGDEAAKKTGDA